MIGLAGFYIIYYKLKDELSGGNLRIISDAAFSTKGTFIFIFCVLLIPVNWGIESFKWKMITAPIEKINFGTAQRSVYSGVCLGNLAPGRATEFLAKIIYFKNENRPQISVLHFVNGMFQLSVTYLLGFIALAFRFNSLSGEYSWIAYTSFCCAVVVMLIFIFSILKIDKVLHFASKKVFKNNDTSDFHYAFTSPLLFKLFAFSFLRYAVFFTQLALLLYLFSQQFTFSIAIATVIYFLITTSIPMISFLEGAIRAAIALFVFSGCGISDTALAVSSISIWVINIIVPSIVGYYFLLGQKFDFSFKKAK
jgi:hypothetical protein